MSTQALTISEAETRAVIAYARSGGSDATDLRDAVHEVTHALDFDVPHGEWDRESLHAAVIASAPADRLAAELLARAVEWTACERAGIAYDVNTWALWACLESVKSGVSMPANTPEYIGMMKDAPRTSEFMGRILEAAEGAS